MSESQNKRRAPLLATLSFLFAAIVGCGGSSQAEHAKVSFDVSPDGKQVVFASDDGDIYLFDLNSSKVRQLTRSVAIESSPTYSPDGTNIVYADSQDRKVGHIFRILLDGTHGEQLTNDPEVLDSCPIYSPDGTRIAFARAHCHRPYSMGGWTWDDWDVYIMDVRGTSVTRLTHKNYRAINRVVFSRDGNSILFSADNNRAVSDLTSNVFEVSVEGSDHPPKPAVPQPTTTGKYAAWAFEPNCSPDGKKIVVISDRAVPFHYDLVVIDVASGSAEVLGATSVSHYNSLPVFTPDGQRILFLAGAGQDTGSRPTFSLWSIGVDGKNAKKMAGSQLFTDPMKWSPSK